MMTQNLSKNNNRGKERMVRSKKYTRDRLVQLSLWLFRIRRIAKNKLRISM